MKSIKKTLCVILTMILLCSAITPVMANNNISVKINGQQIAFDVPPQLINGRTMVPLRAIFEALGANVQWYQDLQLISSVKGDTVISLKINDTKMEVNSDTIILDTPACLVNGRTLVPVRAISEAFGATVNWDGTTNTVSITTNDENDTSYRTAIRTKSDFIKYVKEYGTKQNGFYYVSAVDSNKNKVFLYYMPEDGDSILVGYNAVYGTGVLDLIYVLKEDDTISSYSGTYTITEGNKKLEYTFDGYYKAMDINQYYTAGISGFTVVYEGVDLTGRDPQNDEDSKRLLKTLITENFILSILSAEDNFNLYPAWFNFKSLYRVDVKKSGDEYNVSSSTNTTNNNNNTNTNTNKNNNTSAYEKEYNELIEWGNQKVQEITAEAQEIYNQTLENEKRRYFPNYDNSNLDSYALANMQRQLQALMPTIKQSAELASKAYEAEQLERLAAFLQDEIAKLKQKYNIR